MVRKTENFFEGVFERNNIEIIILNGEPLFNARNVGACLDIAPSTLREHVSSMSNQQVVKLINELASSNVGLTNIRKLNNAGESFLTESGLYKLIMKSRKPSAEAFQDWVCNEVLPTIRKHGVYMTDTTLEKTLADPDYIIGILTAYKMEKEGRIRAEKDKGKIRDKQLASAMGKAGVLAKENAKLKVKLGISTSYASTKAVMLAVGAKKEYGWKELKSYSQEHGYPIKKTYDMNYGAVNVYHKAVWEGVYGIKLENIIK